MAFCAVPGHSPPFCSVEALISFADCSHSAMYRRWDVFLRAVAPWLDGGSMDLGRFVRWPLFLRGVAAKFPPRRWEKAAASIGTTAVRVCAVCR
jgi:hypothetical protein